jgi:hypothetical protein
MTSSTPAPTGRVRRRPAPSTCVPEPHCTVIPALTNALLDALRRPSAVPFAAPMRTYAPVMAPEDATALTAQFLSALAAP